jgi:O-antigen ligase
VYIVLLLAIPSVLRLPALGGVGYPAALFAMPLGLWWCWSHARGLNQGLPISPVRVALFALLASILCSYGWAMRRAIPPVEASQADIGVLRTLVFVSVVLVAGDGIPTWKRFLTLVRWIAVVGGVFALLGLAQFFTNRSLIEWIALPGFSAAQDAGVILRSGFTRASATAIHPLEYAAGLSMLFPLALTVAIYDSSRRPLSRWVPAAAIALALVLSGSRSGYLGLLVGMVVLALSWTRRVLVAMAAACIAMTVVVFVMVPGMVGTIRGLFMSTGTDASTASRSSSYGLVEEFFLRSPVLGRGFGTFLPMYRILDNQILLLLVETGLLGLLAFIGLGATASACAARAGRRFPAGLPRQLGQALCASTVAAMVLMFFFDALGFPISGGTLALSVGLCGAYWRLSGPGNPSTARPGPSGRAVRAPHVPMSTRGALGPSTSARRPDLLVVGLDKAGESEAHDGPIPAYRPPGGS